MANEINLGKFGSKGIGLEDIGTGSMFRKEYDYRGIFSPSRKEIDSNDSNVRWGGYRPITKNIFGLDSYYWYPENFSTYFNIKDLYNSVDGFIKNAAISKDGSISSIYIATAQNAIKSTAKEVTNTFGAIKPTINSITGQKVNENGGESLIDLEKELFESIPYIKIVEFQPLQELESFLRNMKILYEVIQDLFSSNQNASRLDRLKGVFSLTGMEDIINEILESSKDEPDYIRKLIRIPNFFYENMIGGTYTAQYKVPFFNQETYLNANGSQGWESRSIKQQFLGNFVSGLVDKIPGIGQFDIAGRPKFSLEGNNPLPDQVITTFQLYNYNMKALESNLKFIHALVPGAFWIQAGFTQISSNLYDIVVPGRFRYYLCKADIKIDWNGKTRNLSSKQIDPLMSRFPKISNREALSKVPDYYTITISFTSLLPNNFNVYLNYLIGGNEVSVGQFKQEKTSKVMVAVRNKIDEIVDGTKPDAANNDNVQGRQK